MSSDASWPFPLEETGAYAGRGRWGAVRERERERQRDVAFTLVPICPGLSWGSVGQDYQNFAVSKIHKFGR